MLTLMKKYLTSLNVIFVLQVIVILLVVLGLAPKELVLIFSGLMLWWLIFSPVKDSLLYFLASIPLFVALPLSQTFDQMANWRIFLSILFLAWFFRNFKTIWGWLKKQIWSPDLAPYTTSCCAGLARGKFLSKLRNSVSLVTLSALFLIIAILSLTQAQDIVAGIKKILFLSNIALLFFIVKGFCQSQENIILTLKALAVGGITVIFGWGIQLIFVFARPLHVFWHFWDSHVIDVFYGSGLAKLLSFSNTWFAYYESRPPTLRVFSFFPDSHSLAMFLLLMVPVFLALTVYNRGKGRKALARIFWIGIALLFFGVALSGSRGAWVSFLPAVLAAGYIFFRKTDRPQAKKVFLSVVLFILMFAVSLAYPLVLYKFQALQEGKEIDFKDFFRMLERVRSVSDLDELSNLGRIEIWDMTLKSFSEHPWLGVGIGNYPLVIEKDISAGKKGASAHNLYLEVGNEIGVFGVIVFVLIFLEILKTAWLAFKKSKAVFLKAYALSFGLYFIWILSYCLFDVVLFNDKVLLLFVSLTGIAYSLNKN